MTTDHQDLDPITEAITDYATLNHFTGEAVEADHTDASYGIRVLHPRTQEHLSSIVCTVSYERRCGAKKYRVTSGGKERGQCHTIEAAKYLALSLAIETVAERAELAANISY